MEKHQLWPVGGIVRDGLRGLKSHDLDCVLTGPASWVDAQAWVAENVGEVVKVKDQTFTCVTLLNDEQKAFWGENKMDVVWARREFGRKPGTREPLVVEPGTLADDLTRRDFTVNAMALDAGGGIIDLHGGLRDLERNILRFVGDPNVRIDEDPLRILRALRFEVTKGLTMDADTWAAVNSKTSGALLADNEIVSIERVDIEISKMLAHDPVASMKLLVDADNLHDAIFRNGFGLCGTLKVRKKAQ